MACHNVCANVKAPVGVEHILDFEAKNCVCTKAQALHKNLDKCLREQEIMYAGSIFRHNKKNDSHTPGLCIRSKES